MDGEKVIKGLQQHCEGSMFDRCGECPYYEVADEPFQCRDALLMDAYILLKEQEAVEPQHNHLFPGGLACGKCGMGISGYFDYCPYCGQKVKWNGRR